MKINRSLLFLSVFLVALCGCPDYSHLRTPPDYANMTDPDTGDEEQSEGEQQADYEQNEGEDGEYEEGDY